MNTRRIGILTSSRADFSIYKPLIHQLNKIYSTEIIAFGTHLNPSFGLTYKQIEAEGFEVKHKLTIIPEHDSAYDIAKNIGDVITGFAAFWNSEKFDLVFCLGDRYEMFAAVVAGSVFNIKFAHLYGGEKTLGAIDDAFRHSITHMSQLHFASCEEYKNRIVRLKESSENIFNIGSLSYDNLKNIEFYNIDEFKEHFNIDLSLPTILTTIHPETVGYSKNKEYAEIIYNAFYSITNYQILITMPNADTNSNFFREKFRLLASENNNIKTVENLGTVGYLSAMKHCKLMLGNTSSGFVEAAWFPKRVINIGHRQDGRLITPNIISVDFNIDTIVDAVNNLSSSNITDFRNPYGSGDSSVEIMTILNNYFNYN